MKVKTPTEASERHVVVLARELGRVTEELKSTRVQRDKALRRIRKLEKEIYHLTRGEQR